MAGTFGPRRPAGRGSRRPDWRVRVVVGLSPIWLLGGFMLAGKMPVSDGPPFAGSAAVADNLEPLTPANPTDGEQLAGIDPSESPPAAAPDGTELASLARSTIEEAIPQAAAPAAALDAAAADTGDEIGMILRAAAGPEERARAHAGWRTAPDGRQPGDGQGLAETGSLLVEQPRWRDRAAASVPVPSPRPEWAVDDPAGMMTRSEARTAPEPESDGAVAGGADARIVIHHGTPVARSAAHRLGDIVEIRGLGSTELRTVDVGVAQASVRYFHPGDRAAAEAVNRVLREAGYGSQLKDFTNYDPPPSPGTVEVWLPG